MNNPSTGIWFKIQPLPPMPALARLWNSLENSNTTFFSSWNWIGAWLRSLPKDIKPLLLIAGRSDSPVGAGILVRHSAHHWLLGSLQQICLNATGNLQFDCITIEHNDFVGETGLIPHFVRWFAEEYRGDDSIVLPGISTSPEIQAGILLQSDRIVEAFANNRLPELRPTGVGSVLTANSRSQLNRSLKKLSLLGEIRLEKANDIKTALSYFDAMKELHVLSWTNRKKPHAFQWPYFETFHRDLISNSLSSGVIQMLKLSIGDQAFGYLYNFRYHDGEYAYQSGLDYSNPALRPGYACHALAIEQAAREGLKTYDFLAGKNQLKETLGPDIYRMTWRKFSRPRAALRAEAAIRKLAIGAARKFLRVLSV